MESDEESEKIEINEEEPDLNPFTDKCGVLHMITVPTFGKYSDNYTFLEQVLVLKSSIIPPDLPDKIRNKIDELTNSYPEVKPEYFHITLSTGTFLSSPQNENEVNPSYTTLNLISHPYIFYNCQMNQEHRSHVYCAAFTDEYEKDSIKQGEGNDILRINPDCPLNDGQLKRDVILHLGEGGVTSISPNNCAILINLNAQIINFYVIVCGTYNNTIVKCFVGNFVIIPNANNSIIFGDLYNCMIKEKNKAKLTSELILLKNKFKDYIDYVYNYGVDKIMNNAHNLNDVKNEIISIFKIIFDYSGNDDQNSKNIHEIELNNMGNYYYGNFLNYICDLYEFSRNICQNFGEEMIKSSIRNKFIEQLLIKYAKFNIKRMNSIINNFIYFIYENEDISEIEDKANQKYEDHIKDNFKIFICDLLNNESEDKLNDVKEKYGEDNFIFCSNPTILSLEHLNECIMDNGDINNELNQLDDVNKLYLFYIVWKYKGCPMNVHNDFGRVSFLNIDIDPKYYCNKNDKINCCKQLMDYLDKADEKN